MWRLSLLAVLLGAGAPLDGDDPLLALLAQDDDPGRRGAIQDLLRARGGDGCAALSVYARARDARARENAVRAMGEAGCSGVEEYRPYFSDGSAWVADALLDSLSRNRVEAGVPYALSRLDDRRRLVSGGGSWSVAQTAHRTLRTLTGQPIPGAVEPTSGGLPAPSRAAWRSWYAAHGDEPAAEWIASGLERMRQALAGTSAARRLEALETAALIGEPGRPLLAEALRRGPSDLAASLSCIPDEPPRVVDQIPCVLSVTNSTSHRVALAPGEVGVEIEPWEPQGSSPRIARRSAGSAGERERPGRKTGAGDPATPDGGPEPHARGLEGRFVDLGPGESLRRQVRVGPVGTAGRYQVRVGITDLWGGLDPGPYEPPPIESALILRFEQ